MTPRAHFKLEKNTGYCTAPKSRLLQVRESCEHTPEKQRGTDLLIDTSASPGSGSIAVPSSSRQIHYELVGVVVHSGQANAGHYYSYIKDRR